MGRLFSDLIEIFGPGIEYQIGGGHGTEAVGRAGPAAETGEQRIFHFLVPFDPLFDDSAKQGQTSSGNSRFMAGGPENRTGNVAESAFITLCNGIIIGRHSHS